MKETGVDHVYIEPIKETPREHIEQLRAIEGQCIGELGTLNHRVEGRTQEHHFDDNKEKKAEYGKLRHEEKEKKLKSKIKYIVTFVNLISSKKQKYKHNKNIRHSKQLNNGNEQKQDYKPYKQRTNTKL